MSNLEDTIFDDEDLDEFSSDLQHTRFTTIVSMAEYFLTAVAGLDVSDPQEVNTPRRFVKALRELTTPDRTWEFTTFKSSHDEMVVLKGIEFASLCRHHVLPFLGVCHVAYVPKHKLAGLSKIPRFVAQCAAGLRTQEELAAQIADGLMQKLDPLGVGVMMEATHTCMTIRGARSSGTTYTGAMRGVFSEHAKTAKAEFLAQVAR